MKQAEHQAQGGDNEAPQETTEKGPTIEMFEEKQLLAVHMELKEKVAMEKQAIVRLSEQIGQQRRSVGLSLPVYVYVCVCVFHFRPATLQLCPPLSHHNTPL